MTTYYERKEATETPQTFLNKQYGYSDLALDYPKLNSAIITAINEYVYHVFIPLPSPIPSMTLEEAQDETSKKYGYPDFQTAFNLYNRHYLPLIINEAAELYTLSLKQELEGLKEKLKQSEYNLLVISETAADLEQRANILTEALEKYGKHHKGCIERMMFENNVICTCGFDTISQSLIK